MNLLVIDSTADNMVVAACKDNKIASRTSTEGNKKHNSLVLPFVDQVLNELELDKSELNAIACVVGAGSFTGIRVGIATAQALSTALRIPTISITAFEEMVFTETKGKFIAAIDCRHNNYYCGEFDSSWKNIIELKSHTKEEIENLGIKVIYKTRPANAEYLIEIAKYKFEHNDFKKLDPLYMKKSQAEREKDGE